MDTPERITKFADILLPVPLPRTFTYRVPVAIEGTLTPMLRVIVPFGPKKILTGIVIAIHGQPPADHEAKSILEVLDALPVFNEHQVKLFNWMADYYLCTTGEVLNAAMPSGLKLSSESLVQINPAFDFDEPSHPMSEKEWAVLHRIRHETISYTDLSKFLGVKNLHNILKSLRLKEAVIILEEVREKYQPKVEKRIRFTPAYCDRSSLEHYFSTLRDGSKQEEVLLELLHRLPVFHDPAANAPGVTKSILIKESGSASMLKTLMKKGVIEEFQTIVSRFPDLPPQPDKMPDLSSHQQDALRTVMEAFGEDKPVLLHGITGSGKTELYITLVKKALDSGGQALLLLPEIALTTQIVIRLRRVFGKELGIYHSRFSDNERVEVWNGVAAGTIRVVVGVRSSVFLPFENLGLVIVDEEHDSSYKQDRTPRYHARDTALMLARIHHARIVLGTGTPSAESWYHVSQGNFRKAELTERYGASQLPDIRVADIGAERRNKTLKGSFTLEMIKAMEAVLAAGDQVILFQNRRGYAPCLECADCGHVSKCVNCSVSLTYHQFRNALICHYCGYREPIPSKCPGCSGTALLSQGPGTEKLEEEVRLHFPDIATERMDLDTTRSRQGYERIIDHFALGRSRILVGTQMVTKGLDFDRVGLVGVFDADRLMHFPDFRSQERAFQVITQVSGRSGRRDKKGQVIVQSNNPQHPLFGLIREHRVKEFLEKELADREATNYPPFSRLIEITFRHPDRAMAESAATWFAGQARKAIDGVTVLGPAEPPVSRIRNEFLQTVLIKVPRTYTGLAHAKARLVRIAELLRTDRNYQKLRMVFDVDPV